MTGRCRVAHGTVTATGAWPSSSRSSGRTRWHDESFLRDHGPSGAGADDMRSVTPASSMTSAMSSEAPKITARPAGPRRRFLFCAGPGAARQEPVPAQRRNRAGAFATTSFIATFPAQGDAWTQQDAGPRYSHNMQTLRWTRASRRNGEPSAHGFQLLRSSNPPGEPEVSAFHAWAGQRPTVPLDQPGAARSGRARRTSPKPGPVQFEDDRPAAGACSRPGVSGSAEVGGRTGRRPR